MRHEDKTRCVRQSIGAIPCKACMCDMTIKRPAMLVEGWRVCGALFGELLEVDSGS